MIQVKIKWTKTTRALAYLSVLCILAGVFFIGYNHGIVDLEDVSAEMREAREAHAKADSVLTVHRVALVIMQAELDSLRNAESVAQDSTDKSIEEIDDLTKVVVTPEVINEAIAWIKEHNKQAKDTVL